MYLDLCIFVCILSICRLAGTLILDEKPALGKKISWGIVQKIYYEYKGVYLPCKAFREETVLGEGESSG